MFVFRVICFIFLLNYIENVLSFRYYPKLGEDIKIFCDIENLGSDALPLWRGPPLDSIYFNLNSKEVDKDINVLKKGRIFRDGKNLIIKNVTIYEKGYISCEYGGKEAGDFMYIKSISFDKTVARGSNITLECNEDLDDDMKYFFVIWDIDKYLRIIYLAYEENRETYDYEINGKNFKDYFLKNINYRDLDIIKADELIESSYTCVTYDISTTINLKVIDRTIDDDFKDFIRPLLRNQINENDKKKIEEFKNNGSKILINVLDLLNEKVDLKNINHHDLKTNIDYLFNLYDIKNYENDLNLPINIKNLKTLIDKTRRSLRIKHNFEHLWTDKVKAQRIMDKIILTYPLKYVFLEDNKDVNNTISSIIKEFIVLPANRTLKLDIMKEFYNLFKISNETLLENIKKGVEEFFNENFYDYAIKNNVDLNNTKEFNSFVEKISNVALENIEFLDKEIFRDNITKTLFNKSLENENLDELDQIIEDNIEMILKYSNNKDELEAMVINFYTLIKHKNETKNLDKILYKTLLKKPEGIINDFDFKINLKKNLEKLVKSFYKGELIDEIKKKFKIVESKISIGKFINNGEVKDGSYLAILEDDKNVEIFDTENLKKVFNEVIKLREEEEPDIIDKYYESEVLSRIDSKNGTRKKRSIIDENGVCLCNKESEMEEIIKKYIINRYNDYSNQRYQVLIKEAIINLIINNPNTVSSLLPAKNDFNSVSFQGVINKCSPNVEFFSSPPNIGIQIQGYNIYKANPMVFTGVDTGYAREIFVTEYGTGPDKILTPDCRYIIPNGYKFYSDYYCDIDASIKEVRSQKNLKDIWNTFVKASVQVKAIKRLDVGVSANLNIEKNVMKKEDYVRLYSTAECSLYTILFNHKKPPKFSESFLKDLVLLSNHINESEYFHNFFESYGTHYLTNVRFGARYMVEDKIKSSDYIESKKFKIDVSAYVSFGFGMDKPGGKPSDDDDDDDDDGSKEESSKSTKPEKEKEDKTLGYKVRTSFNYTNEQRDTIKRSLKNIRTQTMSLGALPSGKNDVLEWASRVKEENYLVTGIEISIEPLEKLFINNYHKYDLDYLALREAFIKQSLIYCENLVTNGYIKSCYSEEEEEEITSKFDDPALYEKTEGESKINLEKDDIDISNSMILSDFATSVESMSIENCIKSCRTDSGCIAIGFYPIKKSSRESVPLNNECRFFSVNHRHNVEPDFKALYEKQYNIFKASSYDDNYHRDFPKQMVKYSNYVEEFKSDLEKIKIYKDLYDKDFKYQIFNIPKHGIAEWGDVNGGSVYLLMSKCNEMSYFKNTNIGSITERIALIQSSIEGQFGLGYTVIYGNGTLFNHVKELRECYLMCISKYGCVAYSYYKKKNDKSRCYIFNKEDIKGFSFDLNVLSAFICPRQDKNVKTATYLYENGYFYVRSNTDIKVIGNVENTEKNNIGKLTCNNICQEDKKCIVYSYISSLTSRLKRCSIKNLIFVNDTNDVNNTNSKKMYDNYTAIIDPDNSEKIEISEINLSRVKFLKINRLVPIGKQIKTNLWGKYDEDNELVCKKYLKDCIGFSVKQFEAKVNTDVVYYKSFEVFVDRGSSPYKYTYIMNPKKEKEIIAKK